MNALQRFFTLRYPYLELADQRRAQGLIFLNGISLLLAAGAGIIFLLGTLTPVTALFMMILAPALAILALVSLYLLQNGRLAVAAGLYIGFAWVSSLILVAASGIAKNTTIVLVLPVMAASMLLERHAASIVAVLVALSIFFEGILEDAVLRPGSGATGEALAMIVVISLYAALLRLFSGESRAAFGRLSNLERKLEAGTTLSQVIANEASPTALPERLAEVLRIALELHRMRIFLQDEANPTLLRMQGEGETRADRRSITLSTQSPLTEAFKSGKPVLVTTVDLSSRWREFLPGTRAELALPLQVGGQTLGVADLQSTRIDYFDELNVAALQVLVSQIALAIYSARLALHERQQADEQQRVYEQAQRYAQEVQRLNRQLAGTAWGHFFVERGADVIGFDAAAEGEPVLARTIPPSMETALATGHVAVRPSADGCILSVPIALRGQPLGAMEFRVEGRDDVPQHLVDLAETVAGRLSLALDNARLFEQAQTLAQRERQIGLVATRLQRAANLENLLAVAAQEFNEALGGMRTHIQLRMRDSDAPESAPSAASGGSNGHTGSGGTR